MIITKQEIIRIMIKDLHNNLTDYQQILIELKILKKAKSSLKMKKLIAKYQGKFFDFQQYCQEQVDQQKMKLEKKVAKYVEYLIKKDASEDLLTNFLQDAEEMTARELRDKYKGF